MSLTEAEASAAAALTDNIIGDFQKKGGYEHIPVVAEAAAAVAPQPVAATPVVVSSSPTPAAPAADAPPDAEIAPEVPSFEPDLSDELRALLETPDFEAEAEAEITAELEETDPNEYNGNPDQDKKLRALEKRNAWLESQVVAKSRKGWVEENLRAYPLLRTYAKDEVEGFDASSRRAFARQAAELNGRLEKIAKPMLDDIAKLKESLKGEGFLEGKADAKAAFGAPAGDVAGTGASAAHADRLAAAEESGDELTVLKVMLETTPLV